MVNILGRYYNASLSAYSLTASTLFKKHILAGMPVAVSVELSSHCNLNCPECPTGTGSLKREKGFMDILLFERLVEELSPYLLNLNLYFQGEPMMHPELFSFLEKCRHIKSTISTNGHFLTSENCLKLASSGISTIIISLDGMDSLSYQRYRIGGDFDLVCDGIRNLSVARKRAGTDIEIIIQFLVNRFNEHQIIQARRFARETGCRLALKSMQVTDISNAGDWMPADEKFRRYRMASGAAGIKSDMHNRCARVWLNPVITWDGMVLPCCFDKDASHIMGDFNTDNFRDIWAGAKFRTFREGILKRRSMNSICRNCTSGIKGVKT